MSWSLKLWLRPFLCRLNSKFIMQENPAGRMSLDFQQSISEVRKLPLSFQYPAEDLNWKKKKIVILVEIWQNLLCIAFTTSYSQSKKEEKSGWGGTKTQKIQVQTFWLIIAMKATVLVWWGLNLLKLFLLKVENISLFYLWPLTKSNPCPPTKSVVD